MKYQAAERGSEVFRDLYETQTTTDDVRSLRISANTHGAATALDLQLTALTIRADRLPSFTQVKAARKISFGLIGYILVLIGVAGCGYAVWHNRDHLKHLLRRGAGK